MSNYTGSALKGAFIGAAIMWVVNWVIAHFATVLGLLLGMVFVSYVLAPLFNDDINASEMRDIVDRRIAYDYTVESGGYITYSITNPSRFLLTSVSMDCGVGDVPLADIQPGEQAVQIERMEKHPIYPADKCTFGYTPVEVNKARNKNVLGSSN